MFLHGWQRVQNAVIGSTSSSKGFMFFSIHFELEREVEHQVPRHLNEWDMGNYIHNLWLLIFISCLGFDGLMTVSHFSEISSFPRQLCSLCYLQSDRLVDKVRMSSVWESAPTLHKLSFFMLHNCAALCANWITVSRPDYGCMGDIHLNW